MKKETILVTGILGFIGFHVAMKLHELGYQVIGFDNLNNYYPIKWKLLRLKQLRKYSITCLYQDLKDFSSLSELIEVLHPDKIVHLAAQAGVRYSLENPSSYMESNCLGFYHLLEAVKHKRIPIVYASSSSVYGGNTKIPFSEEDSTDLPRSLYAATKKSNELMAKSYHHLFNIPLIGLRFFTVYGPYGRPDMAYFFFTDKIFNNQPITLFNQGTLQRDFTYIDDIVDGVIQAMNFPVYEGIFNLGNHQPTSTHRLVEIIEKKLSKKGIIHHEMAPNTEVLMTFADIEKSKKILRFEPKTCLEKGMDHFIDWYLNSLENVMNLQEEEKLQKEFYQSSLKLLWNKQ